ncbi:MFS transporter [Geosporobacter ferrireducens]|uniref:MFS transporter n=1 Tax=Geosporobacter ferrireducens TaxID=1424294 RepID=A0A1D8GDI8_9FIRM|nr:MFS transporter [Geosporobacter ferrireducens]AOT68973.1 MFS transporter [Geosporobacter ferrireducens]MTI54785.1 MFS transporter [Geosporobacter ferrireducens]
MFQLLLVIIYITFISLGLPDSLLGSAWPSMYLGLKVPISYAGIISMIIAGCTIISSLLSDRLVRKIGTGWITAISVGTTATALFGFSISHAFVSLCIWAVPYGLGAGSVDAVLNNFVALHYKAKHMSWLHCFWGIGATLGPYIMGVSLTGNLGWHYGYRTISLIQIALTAILLFSLPLWKKNLDQKEDKHNASSSLKYKQLIGLPGAKQTLIALFCYCSLEQVTGLWGSSYMVLKKGITSEAAASFISLFYLGITGGRFLSGLLTLKLNTKGMIRLGQGLIILGVALLFVSINRTVMSTGLILIGLGCAPIYPSLLHQTPERFGKNASQSMMGLQMACAYIGSTFSPPLIGLLTEKISITIFPLFQLMFTVAMILLIEYCNRKSHSDRRTVNE